MKKTYADKLTDKEKEIFTDHFYAICDPLLQDFDSPCPWGCPWYNGTPISLRGESIEKMAENYWEENKELILNLIEEEEVFWEEEN